MEREQSHMSVFMDLSEAVMEDTLMWFWSYKVEQQAKLNTILLRDMGLNWTENKKLNNMKIRAVASYDN